MSGIQHHSMGNRIFRLNDIVRQVVKERLKELEEPIVKIVIESFRKVLQEEKDVIDPFDCLKEPPKTNEGIINMNDLKLIGHDGSELSFMSTIYNNDSGPMSMTMAPFFSGLNQQNKSNNNEDVKHLFLDTDKIGFEGSAEAAGSTIGIIDDEDDEEEEDIPVVTKEINGKKVYVFIEDDVAKTFGGHAVYKREVKDDGSSEAGDIVGFLDDHDEYWSAVEDKGKILGFEKDNLYVPTMKGTTYPEWEKMEPKD
jgi:hypothetical protein